MAGYTTFLGALLDTVATTIGEGNNPFSPVNGFTITEDDTTGVYSIEGEAWGFYMSFDKSKKEWFVIGDMFPDQAV